MIRTLSSSNAIVQLRTAPEMRGRVVALRGLVIVGAQPIAGLLAGYLGANLGPRWALFIAGAGTVIGVAAVGRWLVVPDAALSEPRPVTDLAPAAVAA
jgi:MFS family permease